MKRTPTSHTHRHIYSIQFQFQYFGLVRHTASSISFRSPCDAKIVLEFCLITAKLIMSSNEAHRCKIDNLEQRNYAHTHKQTVYTTKVSCNHTSGRLLLFILFERCAESRPLTHQPNRWHSSMLRVVAFGTLVSHCWGVRQSSGCPDHRWNQWPSIDLGPIDSNLS